MVTVNIDARNANIVQALGLTASATNQTGAGSASLFSSAVASAYAGQGRAGSAFLDQLAPSLSRRLYDEQSAIGGGGSASRKADMVLRMIEKVLAPILMRAGGAGHAGRPGWSPLRHPDNPTQALSSPGLRSTTLEPGVLRTMLSSTGGAGVNYNGHAFGVRGGRFSSEIDGNEALVFKAPLIASGQQIVGARVDLASLYSREGGLGERGAIEVYKSGQLLDTIAVEGTRNGRLSVDIGRGFDELRFRADSGRSWGPNGRDGSDFALAGVTLHQREALPPPPPPPPPPSPPPIVERRIGGEALGGSLASSGGAVNYIDGSWGIQGRERDEIDRGETMYFRTSASPGKEILGAKVDLAKIFSNRKEHEAGFVEVFKAGQLVDKIAFNGTAGGAASVDINKGFDELRFTTDGSRKSDYALGAVTLRERAVAPTPPAPLPVPEIPREGLPRGIRGLDNYLDVMRATVSSFGSLSKLARAVNADEALLEIADRLRAARNSVDALSSGTIERGAARDEMRWSMVSALHGLGSVTSTIGPLLPDTQEARWAMARLADNVARIHGFLRYV